MGRPGKRPARLSALAKEAGLPQNEPILELQRPYYPSISPLDETRVSNALLRSDGADSKKSFKALRRRFSRSSIQVEDYSRKITLKLQELYENGCTAGEALILVDMGANVNVFQPMLRDESNKPRAQFQATVRSDIFTRAVASGRVDMVNVLATTADQVNLNDGLKIAVSHGFLEIVTILMVAGADPLTCQAEIKNVVDCGSNAIIPILCGGLNPLTRAMATEYLHEMVLRGQPAAVRSLLRLGASADIDSPSALLAAIVTGSIVNVAALCHQAQYPPSPGHLARGVLHVFNTQQISSPGGKPILELLLAAGASGTGVGEAVVLAAQQSTLRPVLELLLEYSGFDPEYTSRAVVATIANADYRSFELLLNVVERSESRDEFLLVLQQPFIRNSVRRATRRKMVSKIVEKGTTAKGLSNALQTAIDNQEVDMIHRLIDAGAQINAVTDTLMQMAIQSGSMNLLSSLIKSKPTSTACFDDGLRFIGLKDVPFRSEKIKALLDAGGKVLNADHALRRVIEISERTAEHYSIMEFLLQVGAKVDTGEDGCLMVALQGGDWRAVELLAKSLQEGSNLDTMLTASNKIQDLDSRFQILQSLLQAGAQGPCVTKVLIDVLERIPREKRFSRLLVQSGELNINLLQGKVVGQAVMHQDAELLRMLVKCQPTTDTLNKALKKALILEEGPIRLEICQILLEAGATGDEINNALVRAAVATPSDLDLAKLLVSSGASIDHKTGMVLKIAIEKEDLDLLKILLQHPAQPSTITRIIGQAMAIEGENRLPAAFLLLQNTKIPTEALGGLLVEALGDAKDLRLFHLLLSKGASVNVGSLEVFQKAITLNRRSILDALLNAGPTESTLRQVFAYAWQAKERLGFSQLATIASNPTRRNIVKLDEYLIKAVEEVPYSIPLITFLMKLEASTENSDDRCVRIAIQRSDLPLLQLLMRQTQSKPSASRTTSRALRLPEIWDDPNVMRCLPILLGVSPVKWILNENLLFAARNFSARTNAPGIMDILIGYGADSDYRDGEILEIAARAGNYRLLERLLRTQPCRSTIINAFPYIFHSESDTDELLRLINLFATRSKSKLGLLTKHKELLPVLFMCVSRDSGRVTIMQALLKAGISASQTAQISLADGLEAENVSILLYVAQKASSTEGPIMMDLLVSNGAAVNFTTPISRLTPLLAAARWGNAAVVRGLINRGANVSDRDKYGKTSLFYATTTRDLNTMKFLITAKAPINDGSLQEAVRLGYRDAIPFYFASNTIRKFSGLQPID